MMEMLSNNRDGTRLYNLSFLIADISFDGPDKDSTPLEPSFL